MSEEALQITVKRREAKGKGGKERYTHLNAEFQTIARRDKKAFLNDQCKEREESNRMGKTRNLFKKIRDTKGTFHEKMGTIKDRNGMDLTEAEDIKKRWQEYTELYKKILSCHVIIPFKKEWDNASFVCLFKMNKENFSSCMIRVGYDSFLLLF